MVTWIADIDDIAAFMAAARSFKLEKEYGKPPAPSEDMSSKKEASQFKQEAGDAQECFEAHGDAEVNEVVAADQAVTLDQASAIGNSVLSPMRGEHQPEVEQDRGDLMTLTSWGTPEARDRPGQTSCLWCMADKSRVSLITPSGNAHVVFCHAAECKSFYDKHPNGINLDKERNLTVFVDLGREVDVVSSQLSLALSAGSTRVVRAVGVNINVTLTELVKLATGANRKLEKIIDTYVPGSARSVSFRFCSIGDAVRFRAALVRVEEYEQCNVHYAADP
ncbi:hypothetical protein BDW67DRAFT_186971 [Aspergillus spinulosporus]